MFKGGTSLSKGYNLISRFSEDIDITVFRDDIHVATSAEELDRHSAIGNAEIGSMKLGTPVRGYIQGDLRSALGATAKQVMEGAGQDPNRLTVVLDETDPDAQSLLIRYPTVAEAHAYIAPFVKIEVGPKSALDPHESRAVSPYVADDLKGGDALTVSAVTTTKPEWTFLDKILILHGLPIYFEKNGRLYSRGQVSRHYYDAHKVVRSTIAGAACADTALIDNCVRHARTFFYRKDTGLDDLARGRFRLRPPDAMLDTLHRDYDAMATMIFGEVPDFKAVLESVSGAEAMLNA